MIYSPPSFCMDRRLSSNWTMRLTRSQGKVHITKVPTGSAASRWKKWGDKWSCYWSKGGSGQVQALTALPYSLYQRRMGNGACVSTTGPWIRSRSKPISLAKDRRAHWKTTWSTILYNNWSLLWITSDLIKRVRYTENRLHDQVWSLWVPCDAFWSVQRTSYFSENNENNFERWTRQLCTCFHKRHFYI